MVYPELLVRLHECRLVVAQDQDMVAHLERGLPLRDEVALAPLHEDGEGVIGDAHILQQVAMVDHRRADDHLRERAGEVFRQIHVSEDRRLRLLVHQPEPLRHQRHAPALYRQRDEGDEEDDIEDHPSLRQPLHEGIGGEDDRHSPAQPHPAGVEHRIERHLLDERKEGQRDREWATHQHEEEADDDRR